MGDTDRRIVHVLCRHWSDRWQGEDDDDEQRPGNTDPVTELPEESITHIERSGLEHDLGVVVEYTAEEDGDDVAQVERHCCEGEDGIGGYGASEVE